MRIDQPIQSSQVDSNVNSTPNSALGLSRPGFSKALEQVQQNGTRTIQAGDTLTSIVREQAKLQGVKLSPSDEFRWSQVLASDSGIINANAIFPGQKIQVQNMLAAWKSGQLQPSSTGTTVANNVADNPSATQAKLAHQGKLPEIVMTASRPTANLARGAYINAVAHPVLSQTLDRAVERGFIPKVEKQDVYNKVLQVANKHNFAPDDFARLTLMESDGMNPQASNQRCHGIIQFCDGPDRGAAEVGFGKSPKSILGLSVYQQLHLVDTYFDKVGLKKESTVPLDELYLAVLQPAARSEKRPEEPLGIPGKQAKYLYEGRDPGAPMTRTSIAQGLMQNASDRLGFKAPRGNGTSAGNTSMNTNINTEAVQNARIRLQVQKVADYDAIEAPKIWLR
jgi:hypothetical protein